MNKQKENNLVKVVIEIPKNTVAFVVNTLSQEGVRMIMTTKQYDSKDIKELLESE